MTKDKIPPAPLDFSNTEIAFSGKSDAELRQMSWLFRMMNNATLVNVGSRLGMLAVRMRLPVDGLIKNTIYKQFCGGTTLLASLPTVDELAAFGVQTVLDYGAEAKESLEDFNKTMREFIRAIEFANQNKDVAIISLKLTGLGRFSMLEKFQQVGKFEGKEQEEFDQLLKRLDSVCHVAHKYSVGVFIDAEESWIQDTIDYAANLMMRRYNKEKVIIYNTFQLYRHDRLQFLKDSYKKAQEENYLLGAKIVRGAYMDKERDRAEEMGYPSPIQPDKAASDRDYNLAIDFCLEHYQRIGSCTATHNADSCLHQTKLMRQKNIPVDHPHLSFCQLYGMSDHISFNLRNAGYNVSKYVPYGPVKDVVPYLIRRAKENTAVIGDMSRELSFIQKVITRRKL